MGRAACAPPHARAGAPMSTAQLAMWESIHARVRVFLEEARDVDGGAKLSGAEADVAELERLVVAEGLLHDGYGPRDAGPVLPSGASGLAPFVADDVALPQHGGFFDLAEYLTNDDERAAYEEPDTLLTGGDASGDPPARSVPRLSTLSQGELLKLCRRLDDAGILALVPAAEAEDVSPIFAVRKKFDPVRGAWTLRLLFDRRRRNARERHLHGASQDLPHAACFLDIVLGEDERVEIDASDLECFYYPARVSQQRAARNVFGRPLPASLFRDFACYDSALGDGRLVPALATLAMGDRNACDFGQAAHRELLIRAGALDPGCEVHYGAPLPRSRTLHGVMIDDRLSLSIVSRDAVGDAVAARASKEWDAAMDAYADSCGRPVPSKTQRRAAAGRVWGAWLDGRRGTLGGPPERRAALAMLSLRMACCGWASPLLMQRLLGSWVFHLMLRRAGFSVLDAAFGFARSSAGLDPEGAGHAASEDDERIRRLPPPVRSELSAIACLAPLLVTDLRAPVAPRLWCSDASPKAGAVVHAALPADVARDLWRHRESRGAHVHLGDDRSLPGANAADCRHEPAETRALRSAILEAGATGDDARADLLARFYQVLDDAGATRPRPVDPFAPAAREAWASELAEALPFKLALRYPFRHADHINILEANVRLSLVKHLARSPDNFSSRQLLGQDSRVCLSAFAKGRSSSRRLNHVLAKTAAYELAADLQLGGLWVDTLRMPADAPTREGGIVMPSPARPWVSALLAGDLGALDGRLAESRPLSEC